MSELKEILAKHLAIMPRYDAHGDLSEYGEYVEFDSVAEAFAMILKACEPESEQ